MSLDRFNRETKLDQELRFHIDQYIDDLIAQGVDPVEARRRARLELGGIEQSKEECRDARPTRWLEDLLQDIRYAFRTLRQRPGFAAVALITLALGVGATTVMFTVIDGVLLKPFGYRDPARLVFLQEQTDWSTPGGNLWAFTKPNYLDVQRDVHALEMSAWTITRGTVTAPEPAEHATGIEAQSNFFATLGINMALGRDFVADDDRPGAQPVAIISHAYWLRRFAANSAAIGAPLIFDGSSHTIVGITPEGFQIAGTEIPIYTPLGLDTAAWMKRRDRHGLQVWARLVPGANVAQAQAELSAVGQHLKQQYPDSNRGRTLSPTRCVPMSTRNRRCGCCWARWD